MRRTRPDPDDVYDQFRARVTYWMRALHMDDWTLEFQRSSLDDWFAHVEAFWQYRLARFGFDPNHALTKGPEDPAAFADWLDELACHEAMHCVLAPMADALDAYAEQSGAPAAKIADLLHESVTDFLTRIIRDRHHSS